MISKLILDNWLEHSCHVCWYWSIESRHFWLTDWYVSLCYRLNFRFWPQCNAPLSRLRPQCNASLLLLCYHLIAWTSVFNHNAMHLCYRFYFDHNAMRLWHQNQGWPCEKGISVVILSQRLPVAKGFYCSGFNSGVVVTKLPVCRRGFIISRSFGLARTKKTQERTR